MIELSTKFREVFTIFMLFKDPRRTFSKYCKNFHEISVTVLHLGEAGPVAGDLAQQPVVAGGALDDAVIMRAAADLCRPLQQ